MKSLGVLSLEEKQPKRNLLDMPHACIAYDSHPGTHSVLFWLHATPGARSEPLPAIESPCRIFAIMGFTINHWIRLCLKMVLKLHIHLYFFVCQHTTYRPPSLQQPCKADCLEAGGYACYRSVMVLSGAIDLVHVLCIPIFLQIQYVVGIFVQLPLTLSPLFHP